MSTFTKSPMGATVKSGTAVNPFSGISVADPVQTVETVSVTLTGGTRAGSLSDPLGGGSYDPATGIFTETATVTGATTPATQVLQRLVFTAPAAAYYETAIVKVNDAVDNFTLNIRTSPTISGTVAGQAVAPGATANPFANVNLSGINDGQGYGYTITVTDGGQATDADGVLAGSAVDKSLSNEGRSSFYKSGVGTYGFAGRGLGTLVDDLRALTFTPTAVAAGQARTTSFALSVTDLSGPAPKADGSLNSLSAADSTTSIVTNGPAPPPTTPPTTTPPTTIPPTPPGTANFLVTDVSTGAQTSDAGTAYSGPVSGIVTQIVRVTPDNLNVLALTPNVFIHSGSGTDALDVSRLNGNNILDGSTGSNFMTGGTGLDTFFLDDRGLAADVFSTIVNFHSGDNATVFGVSQTNFTQTVLDSQGADGFKGLDFQFTAPNKPNASLVLAGFSKSDIASGKLQISFGTTADLPGVPGSEYMNIRAN